MSKKIQRDNYRVEVYPDDDVKELPYAYEQIAAQVRRHVDHAGVFVVSDDASCCSHCGARWTEDSAEYNGGCCDGDEANNPIQGEAHAS